MTAILTFVLVLAGIMFAWYLLRFALYLLNILLQLTRLICLSATHLFRGLRSHSR